MGVDIWAVEVIATVATIVLTDCCNKRLLPIKGAVTDIGSTIMPFCSYKITSEDETMPLMLLHANIPSIPTLFALLQAFGSTWLQGPKFAM